MSPVQLATLGGGKWMAWGVSRSIGTREYWLVLLAVAPESVLCACEWLPWDGRLLVKDDHDEGGEEDGDGAVPGGTLG